MGKKERVRAEIKALKEKINRLEKSEKDLKGRIALLTPMAAPWMCRTLNVQWCHDCAKLDCGDNFSNDRKREVEENDK